jgi:hypothetical protein
MISAGPDTFQEGNLNLGSTTIRVDITGRPIPETTRVRVALERERGRTAYLGRLTTKSPTTLETFYGDGAYDKLQEATRFFAT